MDVIPQTSTFSATVQNVLSPPTFTNLTFRSKNPSWLTTHGEMSKLLVYRKEGKRRETGYVHGLCINWIVLWTRTFATWFSVFASLHMRTVARGSRHLLNRHVARSRLAAGTSWTSIFVYTVLIMPMLYSCLGIMLLHAEICELWYAFAMPFQKSMVHMPIPSCIRA